jgi:peptidoglycan-associated lipoprotein
MGEGGDNNIGREMRMRTTALIVQGILLTGLAVGCARTPATSTAAAPPPSGSSTSTPGMSAGGGRSSDGGGGTRQASSTASTTRPRIDGFKATENLSDIHFEFDKYELTPEATKTLNAHAEWLKANPKHLVLIEGHCDERGTDAYNVALGERRAKATQNYLAAHGVRTARITVISYGEERPQCSEHTEACWEKNRRAHFMLKAQ